MTEQKIREVMGFVGMACYSTQETQRHSFEMGKHIQDNNIPGDIIECGVAAAGNFASMMLGVLSSENKTDRMFWGFDSFQGIQLAGKKDTSQPGIGDITHDVNVEDEQLLVSSGITVHSKENVISNLSTWGLWQRFPDRIKLVEGWIQHSLPTVENDIKEISILRLDMDVYAPTKFTLEKLFPKMTDGSILIIDDWALDGARIACLEYFEENNLNMTPLDVLNSTPKYFIISKN